MTKQSQAENAAEMQSGTSAMERSAFKSHLSAWLLGFRKLFFEQDANTACSSHKRSNLGE